MLVDFKYKLFINIFLSFLSVLLFIIINIVFTCNKLKYLRTLAISSCLYTYIYMQPSLLNMIGSNIGSRNILGVNYIQADVSKIYDKTYIFFVLTIQIPLLLVISIMLPLNLILLLRKRKF